MSKVPRRDCSRTLATYRLRGLNRLLPLPWAKTTTAVQPSGSTRVPRTFLPSEAISASRRRALSCLLVPMGTLHDSSRRLSL